MNEHEMETSAVERVQAAAERLEKTLAWIENKQAEMNGEVSKIVATVDASTEARCRELESKLQAAEERIAELRAQAERATEAGTNGSRKTMPVATMQLLAKQGVGSLEGLEAGSLDEALTGLSLEQRVAVKAQLIRTGALVR